LDVEGLRGPGYDIYRERLRGDNWGTYGHDMGGGVTMAREKIEGCASVDDRDSGDGRITYRIFGRRHRSESMDNRKIACKRHCPTVVIYCILFNEPAVPFLHSTCTPSWTLYLEYCNDPYICIDRIYSSAHLCSSSQRSAGNCRKRMRAGDKHEDSGTLGIYYIGLFEISSDGKAIN